MGRTDPSCVDEAQRSAGDACNPCGAPGLGNLQASRSVPAWIGGDGRGHPGRWGRPPSAPGGPVSLALRRHRGSRRVNVARPRCAADPRVPRAPLGFVDDISMARIDFAQSRLRIGRTGRTNGSPVASAEWVAG